MCNKMTDTESLPVGALINQTGTESQLFESFNGAAQLSQFIHQITQARTNCLCNSQKRIHRNGTMPVFQQREENHRQPRPFSKGFLRQSGVFAMVADCRSKHPAVFRHRRHAPYKQEPLEKNIYYSINLSLRDCGIRDTTTSLV